MQCFAPFHGQKYIVSSGVWLDEGSPPVTIVDPVMSEVGPGMLLYNGEVIFLGAANSGGHGKTLLYTAPANPTKEGTWKAGPDIPGVNGQVMVCNDCPATLLPNGRLLFTAAKFNVDDILTRDVAGFRDAVLQRVSDLTEREQLGISIDNCEVQSIPPRQLQNIFAQVTIAR